MPRPTGSDGYRKRTRGSPHLSMARPASSGAGQAPWEAVPPEKTGGGGVARLNLALFSLLRQAGSDQTRWRQPRAEGDFICPVSQHCAKLRIPAAWSHGLEVPRMGWPLAHKSAGRGVMTARGGIRASLGGAARLQTPLVTCLSTRRESLSDTRFPRGRAAISSEESERETQERPRIPSPRSSLSCLARSVHQRERRPR